MYSYVYIYVCILSANTNSDCVRIIPGSYMYSYVYIYIYVCILSANTNSDFSYNSRIIYICIYMYTSYTLHESLLWVYMCSSTSKLNVIFALFSCQISRDSSTSILGASVSQQQLSHAPWMLYSRPHISYMSGLQQHTVSVDFNSRHVGYYVRKKLIELPFTE